MILLVKTIKMLILVVILFVSLIFINLPTVTAGPLDNAYRCESVVIIEEDADASNDPFLPFDMIKEIPISMTYKVTGLYADDIASFIADLEYDVYIYLYVTKTPEWCTATISPSLVAVKPSAEGTTFKAMLNVHVNEKVKANVEGEIAVLAEAEGISSIQSSSNSKNISFTPGYLPILKLNTFNHNAEFINPKETIVFDIEVENLGNDDTLITSKLIDPPDGWTITIPEMIIQSDSGDTKKIISLTVKPPDGFGYHNDKEIIQLAITPKYANNNSVAGEEHILYFIVRSKGFSSGLGTPGFEGFLVIIAFISIILIFKFQKRIIRKNKRFFREEEDL